MAHLEKEMPFFQSQSGRRASDGSSASTDAPLSREDQLKAWNYSIRSITGIVKKVLPPASVKVKCPEDTSLSSLDKTPLKLAAAASCDETEGLVRIFALTWAFAEPHWRYLLIDHALQA